MSGQRLSEARDPGRPDPAGKGINEADVWAGVEAWIQGVGRLKLISGRAPANTRGEEKG